MTHFWQGGEGAKDIPQLAYLHLVTVLKADPDYVSQLRCVQQTNFVGDVLVDLIRIFDPKVAEKTVKIKSFASLDQYPDLILYEGYIEKGTEQVHIARIRGGS